MAKHKIPVTGTLPKWLNRSIKSEKMNSMLPIIKIKFNDVFDLMKLDTAFPTIIEIISAYTTQSIFNTTVS